MERGKARRRERPERREVLAQAGREELEELHGARHVLQPMAAERTERGAGERLVARRCRASPARRRPALRARPRRSAPRPRRPCRRSPRRRAPARPCGSRSAGGEPPRRAMARSRARAGSRRPRRPRRARAGRRGTRRRRPSRPLRRRAARGLAHELAHARPRGCEPLAEELSSRVEPSTSAKSSVTVPAGSVRGARRCPRRSRGESRSEKALAYTVARRVRHPLRQAPGDARRPRPRRPPRRGGRLEGDARDPPRAARGRRQPRGRAGLHGVGQGACARPGRPEEPDARPAGREDRPRGADRAHGLGRLAARIRRARRR